MKTGAARPSARTEGYASPPDAGGGDAPVRNRVYVGDVRDFASKLPPASVHCIVTSPPYYQLRAYGTPQVWGGDPACRHTWGAPLPGSPRGNGGTGRGRNQRGEGYARAHPKGQYCPACGAWRGELGQEPTPEGYIAHLVAAFAAVRPALHPSGTVWINIADSYWTRSACRHRGGADRMRAVAGEPLPSWQAYAAEGRTRSSADHPILKDKDLCLIPQRLALALQADGWWVRSIIVWEKPNCLPDAAGDRCSNAHEYVLMLAKAKRYFFDQDAIRTPVAAKTRSTYGAAYRPHGNDILGKVKGDNWGRTLAMRRPNQDANGAILGANKRTIWRIATRPAPVEGHFSTFPPELIRPCVRAGSSACGACPSCGAPWRRLVEKRYENPGRRRTNGPSSLANRAVTAGFPQRLEQRVTTAGWVPGCDCAAGEPIPCLVCDPFLGSGTSAQVAAEEGRDWIGCDLDPRAVDWTAERLALPRQRQRGLSEEVLAQRPNLFDLLESAE